MSSGQQLKPKIDMSLNGTFAIVWEDDSNSNGYYEIMLAGFASNGQRLSTSPSAAVNTNDRGNQIKPDVTLTESRRAFVVWQDDVNKNGYYEIVANDIQL